MPICSSVMHEKIERNKQIVFKLLEENLIYYKTLPGKQVDTSGAWKQRNAFNSTAITHIIKNTNYKISFG